MTTFTESDSIDNLKEEQLKHLSMTDESLVVFFLKENTVFDSNQIRLLLELGKIEATRRLPMPESQVTTACSSGKIVEYSDNAIGKPIKSTGIPISIAQSDTSSLNEI